MRAEGHAPAGAAAEQAAGAGARLPARRPGALCRHAGPAPVARRAVAGPAGAAVQPGQRLYGLMQPGVAARARARIQGALGPALGGAVLGAGAGLQERCGGRVCARGNVADRRGLGGA